MSQSLRKSKNPTTVEQQQAFNYYSLNETDRHRALEALAGQNTVEAIRELIQIFNRSQWRETKLFIIKNIIHCSHERTLEFLIELTSQVQDIPMSEQAIKSLGMLDHELARKYLVHLYKNGPEQLKPATVLALADAHERNLVLQFVTDLAESFEHQQLYLTKNLIYAVGELKCKEAKPILSEIILKTSIKDIALSALMALGKITRDLDDINQFERKFAKDTFDFQIYQNVKNQVMIRANWKAEDYLQKIFNEKHYHPAMPLELNTFSESDVRAGLDLFAAPEKQKALFDVLSKVNFSSTSSWYKEFLGRFSNLNYELFRNSLSYQYSDSYLEIINNLKDIKNEKWFHLVISSLPSADKLFMELFQSAEYKSFNTEQKITVINQYYNWALVHKFEQKKTNTLVKQVENLLAEEDDIRVQARLIRIFAQLSIENTKADSFIKKNLLKKELVDSCIFYLEKNPSSFAVGLLENLVLNELVSSHHRNQLLRAVSAQQFEHVDTKSFKKFLTEAAQINDQKINVNLLIWLTQHPFIEMKSFILKSLHSTDPEIQLNSVIASKSYQDSAMADDIAKLLSSEIESVSGRALDTLLSIPGLRSKRLAFDYFIQNLNNIDVVEQVCRRFDLPEHSTDYFYKKMEDIAVKNQDHQQIIQLNELRDRLNVAFQTSQLLSNRQLDSEARALDQQLSQKLHGYDKYDEITKSALRSAELPFLHPEMFSQSIDKSTSILGYCKALDIVLSYQLGRKLLFPKLESKLHEFQNLIHLYELNDTSPSYDRVIKNLNLGKHFNQQSMPLHKMSLISQGILSSKIINEHFKVLDGLRAWATVILMFARPTMLTNKVLIQINGDDNSLVALSKKLMWLQDLRNPAAHRQTLHDFKTVEQVRNEVFDTLNSLNKFLKI